MSYLSFLEEEGFQHRFVIGVRQELNGKLIRKEMRVCEDIERERIALARRALRDEPPGVDLALPH